MTVVIKKSSDLKSIEKILAKLPPPGNFNAIKFCGILKLSKSPLDIQKMLRDEWQ